MPPIVSVANVTRADVRGCLELAAGHGLIPEVTTYALDRANVALQALSQGAGRGARVLVIDR
jgi:D-arabinose 1-dehydrogenase-like Zn-dependent alcohol dehydrogenase